MTKLTKNPELDAALDNLIAQEADTTKILGEGGLLKQLTKRLVETFEGGSD